MRLLKVPRRKAIKLLIKADVRLLLETAAKKPDPRIEGIILVAATTALRSGEILHLAWSDVDADALSLRVTAKPGWSPKSHHERMVFVHPAVIEWLQRWRARTDAAESDYIFATRNGTPMGTTNVARAVRDVFEDAGLYQPGQNSVPHSLRHSAATRMLSSGSDLEVVRDILGHADVATTALYLHSSDERKRAAAKSLSID